MLIKCKFCKSENTKSIKKIKSIINNNLYDLYECQVCKCRYFDLHQYSTELSSMYNELSFRDNFPVEFTLSKKWLQQKSIILKILNAKPSSILDVGCRTGDFLMHFDKKIKREGVELSKPFYKTGIQRGLKIYNDILENIEFHDSYDVVSCYAIIEHLEKPMVFLEKINSIVNVDGVLVIMIPTYQSLKVKFHNIIKTIWHMYSPPEHLNLYSKKFLDSYMKEKGFVLKKRYYSSGGMLMFSKNPLLKKIETVLNYIIDNSALNKLPIFDHMYSYYKFVPSE